MYTRIPLASLTSHHLCSNAPGIVSREMLLYNRRRFSAPPLRRRSCGIAKTSALSLPPTPLTTDAPESLRVQGKPRTRSSLVERPARTDRRGHRRSRASASTSTAGSLAARPPRMEGVAAAVFYRVRLLACTQNETISSTN